MSEMSSLERVVYRLLVQAGISFQQEKNFKDCYAGYYRFDFYIPSRNTIIEVNGMQHYQFTKLFHKNRSDFTKAQERDRRKIAYCLANNISLYIIPCWDIDTLKNTEDLFQEKYRAFNKFHNDNVWSQQKA